MNRLEATMLRACGTRAVLALVMVAASAAGARADDLLNPKQGVFNEDWMLIELDGQKVGYGHSQMTRAGDDITTTNLMSIVLKRAGAEVAIKVLQTTKETVGGSVLAFSSRLDASAQSLYKQGRVADGKVHLSARQFDQEMTSEHSFPADAKMSWGALRTQHEKGYAPGTTYTIQIYEPMFSENAAIPVETTIGDKEEIEVEGKKFQVIRTTQNMLGMNTTAWLDDERNIVRTELPMMGIPMVMVRTSRERALAEFSPPEFFMPTTIPSPRPINRERAQSIEFVLRLKDTSVAMPPIPATGMQTPGDADGKTAKLTVSRQNHVALADVSPQSFGDDMRPYLAPNAIINSDDPAVQEMARQARGDAKSPYAIADRLRKYVTDVIDEKNLDVGFATASEVCRNKAGDCSEHAVLLAALGRASGLPARVVTGLVYVPIFGGSDHIFGFHMWTQFRIGDTWVDFDAAQHESDCNPTHIAFNVSSLEGAGLGQIAIDLINVIGNLELEIASIQPDSAQPATE